MRIFRPFSELSERPATEILGLKNFYEWFSQKMPVLGEPTLVGQRSVGYGQGLGRGGNL